MHKLFALLLPIALVGCASLDKYSFETFEKPPAGDRRVANWPARSDKLALLYSDYQARLLEGRGTGSRVTRELSDSSLAVGGALAGAQETLGIAASSIATMGVGMVITRELQGVINARGRSEAFVDAAYLIRQAQSEYRQFNPNPPDDHLTENGAILVSRVDAAMHAALKSLNGRLPGLLDLQQATQPMTKEGADRKDSGTPQTMFNAAGEKTGATGATAAQVQAAVDRAVQELKRAQVRHVGTQIVQPLTPTEAQAKIDSLTAELSGTTKPERIKQLHQDIVGGVQGPDMDALKEAVNDRLRDTRNQLVSPETTVSAGAQEQLKKYLKAFGR